MPRPMKCRKVCCLPGNTLYGPLHGQPDGAESIVMSVEEYESLRLIDLEGLTQEECAERMQVARGTVQSIYKNARTKLAESLVNGQPLRIEGGNFRLRSEEEREGDCPACRRRRCGAGGGPPDEACAKENEQK